MQSRRLEEAVLYLNAVKYKFRYQPQIYYEFMNIIEAFKSRSIDALGVMQRASNLFRGYPELIEGLHSSLLSCSAEILNGQLQVSIPGINEGGVQGPNSLTIHTVPDSTTFNPVTQPNHTGRDASPNVTPVAKEFLLPLSRHKYEAGIRYFDHLKYTLANQPQVYDEFLNIMKGFKSGSIDYLGVVQSVFYLLRGYPELIEGFKSFLPLANLRVQPNGQMQFSIPEPKIAGVREKNSLTIHSTVPDSTTVHSVPQPNTSGRDASPHVAKPTVANNQPYVNLQPSQHQNFPPQINSGTGVSPGSRNSPNSATPPANYSETVANNQPYVNLQSQPNHHQNFPPQIHSGSGMSPGLGNGPNSATPPVKHPVMSTHIMNYNNFKSTPVANSQPYVNLQSQHNHHQNFPPQINSGTGVSPGSGDSSYSSTPPANYSEPTPVANSQHYVDPVPLCLKKSTPVAKRKPYVNDQNQHYHHQNSPLQASSDVGVSPGTENSPNCTAPSAYKPVELKHAFNYVNRIKNRFQDQTEIFKEFLTILNTYIKEQRNAEGGVNTVSKSVRQAEVYYQVAKLFQNQEDLLQEFPQFLLDANGVYLMGLVCEYCADNL